MILCSITLLTTVSQSESCLCWLYVWAHLFSICDLKIQPCNKVELLQLTSSVMQAPDSLEVFELLISLHCSKQTSTVCNATWQSLPCISGRTHLKIMWEGVTLLLHHSDQYMKPAWLPHAFTISSTGIHRQGGGGETGIHRHSEWGVSLQVYFAMKCLWQCWQPDNYLTDYTFPRDEGNAPIGHHPVDSQMTAGCITGQVRSSWSSGPWAKWHCDPKTHLTSCCQLQHIIVL